MWGCCDGDGGCGGECDLCGENEEEEEEEKEEEEERVYGKREKRSLGSETVMPLESRL